MSLTPQDLLLLEPNVDFFEWEFLDFLKIVSVTLPLLSLSFITTWAAFSGLLL